MSAKTSRRVPIAVLASGRGSNYEAIHRAIAAGRLEAEIVALVSDQPRAGALDKAREYGHRAVVVEAPSRAKLQELAPEERELRLCELRAEHERAVIDALRPLGARFLVMAGYMRIVTPALLDEFRSERGYSRIVNVHPSLLPAFPGVNAYAQAFRHGAKVTGVTVHLVDSQMDTGPICAQEAFSIADCASEAEVEKRGLAVEHRLFPETLGWLLPEGFEIEERGERSGRRLCVRPN